MKRWPGPTLRMRSILRSNETLVRSWRTFGVASGRVRVLKAIIEKPAHQDRSAELQLTDLLTASDLAVQAELTWQLHLRQAGDPGFEPATLASIVTALRLDEANLRRSELDDMASQLNAIEVSVSDLRRSS